MKKTLIVLLVTLVVLTAKTSVHAQEMSSSAAEESTISAIPTPTPIPEYTLPYPGLLPDNPLYSLKILRDKFVEMLISDPYKRAEFNVLQSDKRIASGVHLMSKGKWELGESSISKAANYFGDAITKVKEAKKMGVDTVAIIFKMSRAVKKYNEILAPFSKTVPSSLKERLGNDQKRLVDYEKEVSSLM